MAGKILQQSGMHQEKISSFSCQSLTDLHVTYMKLEFGELDGSSLIALKYFLILPDRILPSHTFQLESPFSSVIKFCKRAGHMTWWPCWPTMARSSTSSPSSRSSTSSTGASGGPCWCACECSFSSLIMSVLERHHDLINILETCYYFLKCFFVDLFSLLEA